jgi:hypothetical protein
LLGAKQFWNQVADSGLLTKDNLILVGDFNLTLSSEEVWGGNSIVGHSDGYYAGFYKAFFQEKHLIDLIPDKLVPTWRNKDLGGSDF